MQLADLGADVVKIEDPTTRGDVSRHVPPYSDGDHSLFFESFNRNKRSLALNLRVDEGREAFERLIPTADIVFSNLRGDQPEKLKIRYDDLKALNPKVVCVSLSGFGLTGPRKAQGAYDYTLQGLAGWQSITGETEGPPTKSGLSLVDLCGGYVAAVAMLAGLRAAEQDGVGRDVDLSLFEVALAQLTYIGTWVRSRSYEPIRRDDSAHQSVVPFQNFRASDGWLVVACPKETLWRRFCGAVGRHEWAEDPRFASFVSRDENRVELVRLINEALSTRTQSEWCEIFEIAGVPAAPVNSVSQALDDPQVGARQLLANVEHPVLGTVAHVRSPLTSVGARHPERGPFLGEHTAEILTGLGYSIEGIAALAVLGAISQVPDEALT